MVHTPCQLLQPPGSGCKSKSPSEYALIKKNAHVLLDIPQHPDSLMPPNPNSLGRIDILLLLTHLRPGRIVKRELQPHVGLHLVFGCLEAYWARDLAGGLDLDLEGGRPWVRSGWVVRG